jgi:hypothetical protein
MHVRGLIEVGRAAPAAGLSSAAVPSGRAEPSISALCLAISAGLSRCTAAGSSSLVHARAASQYLLSTRSEHRFERLDAIIGGLEEEVFYDRFRTLEL